MIPLLSFSDTCLCGEIRKETQGMVNTEIQEERGEATKGGVHTGL